MPKEDAQLTAAKRAYRSAKEEGNRQEEARWANVIGDILKTKGEYVEAIHWLRRDYEISVKYLPEKQLLPTCQSLGEVYLRLQDFKEALTYQKKHLELAKDAEDLIEQQRASTQLGRTYHDIFLKSDDDHSAVRNAIKYFNSAMELARALKENSHGGKYSFVKEYIDAHNNIGMLDLDLDNLKEAKKILTKGLEICDEEEVDEDDDTRSRLHHHLGIVYMELREWDKAAEHIREDILICARIGHCQGEAKGYINLGELHYRIQKYDKASRCYQKSLDLAKTMEDEDALVAQINQNIATVKQAINVMKELKKEEQNLKKLTRMIEKGTPHERKFLLQQSACLDRLIDMSNSIFAWTEHLVFAKRKKRIACELCDKEKQGDSFLVIGESYQKLRNFKKAIKWFAKSWETYKSIGNMEGQALAKINIGEVLDCDGDWRGALNAFEEGYRIAVEANLPTTQLSALENIHYSHMIRFDNAEEARRLQHKIDNLKKSKNRALEIQNSSIDCCSETDTEGEDHLSTSRSNESWSPEINKSSFSRSRLSVGVEELNDDMPLISLLRSSKNSFRKKRLHAETDCTSNKPREASLTTSKSSDLQTTVSRKRVRVVLSDDEDEMHDNMDCSKRFPLEEHIATSNESDRKNNTASTVQRLQDNSTSASKCVTGSSNPVNIEEITSLNKSQSSKIATPAGRDFRCMRVGRAVFASDVAVIGTECNIDVFEDLSRKHNAAQLLLHDSDTKNVQYITFRIGNGLIHAEADPYLDDNKLRVKSMTVALACLYYLQLPAEMRSKGLLPIIQHMKCGGRVLRSMETLETLKDDIGNIMIEVSIEGWIQKRLIKLYIDCCEELSEAPNIKLLEKLYTSEVEDEVIASECELQDLSVTPLLNALHTHRTVAMLNLSHNLLGNATMEKLQRFFTTGEKYGDVSLDLHCNRFGPTALFQICECPVLFARLEVLNVSGNRLTDACGSYLSTILQNCRALYSLNIERCCITTRTIQKVAEALNADSVLAKLCIGYNDPVSGNAVIKLLNKLATMKSFAELNLNGLKLNKPVVESLCQLAKTSCLSRLMLGSTGIGTDGALQLTKSLFGGSQDSFKLDVSYCGLTSKYINSLTTDVAPICGIVELNLGGNPILLEGANALVLLLTNPQCCLKILVLNKCQLGLTGLLRMIQALAENDCLKELNLADNIDLEKKLTLPYDSTREETRLPNFSTYEPSSNICASKESDGDRLGLCAVNTDYNQLEVADSEDDASVAEAAPSDFDDGCTSSCRKDSSSECQFILELSTAIGKAKQLQQLELSNNGFSITEAETLYSAWSSRLPSGLAFKHIKDQIIHFSDETTMCCEVKPCCRRD